MRCRMNPPLKKIQIMKTEITQDNLKTKALEAYYASKVAAQIEKDEKEKQFEIKKASVLEELKGKFPGIVDEGDGWFDILGYKFQFVYSFDKFCFGSPNYFRTVTDLEELGSVLDLFTKEKWNKKYDEEKPK